MYLILLIIRIISLYLIFLSFSFLSYSQCGETQFYQLPFDGVPEIIDSDSDGHLVLTARLDNSSVICVMDHARNIVNQKVLGGSGMSKIEDIAIDNDNNIYVCGYHYGSIYFGSGLSFVSTGGTSSSIFVAKLDHNLQAIWAHVSTGPSNSSSYGNDQSHSIAVDSLGGVYYSYNQEGSFEFQGQDLSLPVGAHRMFISKLNSNDGIAEWTKYQVSYSASRYPLLETTGSGGVYEVFNFEGYYIDEQGEFFENNSNYYKNTLVMYFDSTGTHHWSTQVHGGGEMRARDIDENGHLIMYGTIRDTMSVGSDTLFNLYKSSMYYLELDTLGNVDQMECIITSDILNYTYTGLSSIDYIGDGYFLVSGATKLELNFNGIIQPALDPNELTSYAALYDSTFTPIWARTFGIGNSVYNAGIELLNGCSAYYLGNSRGYLDFEDTISINTPFEYIPMLIEFDINTGLVSTGQSGGGTTNDPFGPNGVPGFQSDIDELSGIEVEVYPNPVFGTLNIMCKSPIEFSWNLINNIGQSIANGNENNSATVDMSVYRSGVYFIRVDDGKSSFVKKLVKL